ncbi:hypothetical protein L3X38_004166 [Prunus dulcis]|uniref:Uncharacterized protein n=1 Tax=Prunus dulcis TaxID=3755 RepID=A0AAD5F306_PRUDU|nr:hypothetical protein L3X38_004166 [Prunus dulcis]
MQVAQEDKAIHLVILDTTPIGPVATKAISPARQAGSHQLVPLGSLSKYQAPKTSEAALPQEPFRRNMHVERWRQPAGFNVHITHSNDNNGGIGRGRRNHARVPKKIQDSDDEDEIRQTSLAGAEPALVIHLDLAIRTEAVFLQL